MKSSEDRESSVQQVASEKAHSMKPIESTIRRSKRSRGVFFPARFPHIHRQAKTSVDFMIRVLITCVFVGGILCLETSFSLAQDEVEMTPQGKWTSTSESQRFEEMSVLAKRTKVFVLKDGKEIEATFCEDAILEYVDERRKIQESTLWVWTVDSQPVFFQKIEVNAYNGPKTPYWTFCFSSASEDALRIEWPFYKTSFLTEPKTSTVLKGVEVDANLDSEFQSQLRSLMKEMNVFLTPRVGKREKLRLSPQPLLKFTSDQAGVKGTVFSYVRGINPEAIIVIRATEKDDGKTVVDCTVSHMTSSALLAKFRDTEIHKLPSAVKGFNKTRGFFLAPASAIDD